MHRVTEAHLQPELNSQLDTHTFLFECPLCICVNGDFYLKALLPLSLPTDQLISTFKY